MTDIDIEYTAEPTARRFHRDSSFFRGLRGPWGCLSGDHEFLTRTGWKRIDQYVPGDEVLAVDPYEGRSRFEAPSAYIDESCDDMIYVHSRGIDLLMSPEHRVLHHKKFNAPKPRVCTAEELIAAHEILADGWDGLIPATFSAPENAHGLVLSDDELRLMVAVCADGHFCARVDTPRCSIGLRRPRKKERLETLLHRCGIKWIEYDNPARPTERVYRFDAPERNKALSAYWQANARQIAILREEIPHWDGAAGNGARSDRFTTTDGADAEFVQYVFAASGHRASVVRQCYEDWSDVYEVTACRGSASGVRYRGKAGGVERVPAPAGRKYCFSVSTGFFLTRRNGKVAVTGNSGKSVACVNEIVMRCMDGDRVVGYVEDEDDPDYGVEIRNCPAGPDGVRRARWAIVRNTYGELLSTTIKTWQDWYPDEICAIKQGAPIEGRMRLPLPDGTEMDLELMFLALDRPKDVKKLKSLEVTGIWFNEASEILWENVEAATARPGRFPKKDRLPKDDQGRTIRQFSCVIADTNPPDDDHWWHRLAVVEQPQSYQFFDQPPAILGDGEDDPYRINPECENLGNQPLGADYWMRMIAGKDRAWVRVNLQNQYGTTTSGKPVHPQFKEYWHVSAKPIAPMRGRPLLCGLDMGLTPACVIGQLTPMGQLRFLDELWVEERGMGIKQFLRDVVKPHLHVYYPGIEVAVAWADPAGGNRDQGDGETPYQKAAEVGFPLQAAPVKGNHLQPRKEALDEFLTKAPDGEPGLLIAPHCSMLRKAYAGRFCYERLQVGGEARYRDTPTKNIYSHTAEAGQYLAVGVMYGYQDPSQRRSRATHGTRPATAAGY